MTEPINQKSEIGHFIFCVIIVVYLGHGVLHPAATLFSRNQFLEEVLRSEFEEHQKKGVRQRCAMCFPRPLTRGAVDADIHHSLSEALHLM